MLNVAKEVRNFLGDKNTLDDFWVSEAIVWIDGREYDEDIIEYFNDMMEEKIEMEVIDNNGSYGEDIILIKGQKKLQIPYEEEKDRDTTLKYLNDFIKPKYEIRWFLESLGSDTLGFVLMKNSEWQRLEEEFGTSKLGCCFSPIGIGSKMFDLEMDEKSAIIELRNLNPDADFSIIADWVKIISKEKEYKRQNDDGEIDLDIYLEVTKMINRLKEDFVVNYPYIKLNV